MSYTQLFYLTQWSTSTPPILDRLLSEHLGDLQSQMEEIIWIAGQNFHPQHERLLKIIEALPAEIHQKVLLIPMMYQNIQTFLKFPTVENLTNILTAYEAEYAIETKKTASNEPIWSLMADRHLPAGKKPKIIEGRYLDDCIVLDFDSPEVQKIELSSGVMNMPYEAFSETEKEKASEKLHFALSLIDKISLSAGRLVRNYTRIIRMRKTASGLTSSEQVPREIGTIRLLNAQDSRFSIIDLMDNLIHEATHNFLSSYEHRYGSFIAYTPTTQVRPISPWSGNPIPYSAFTHAVFIYFSLFNFMRLAYRKTDSDLASIDKKEIRSKIELCSKGFRSHTPIQKYLSVVGKSDEKLLNLYQMCQQNVCSHYPVMEKAS